MKDLRLLVDIMGAGFETVIIYYYFRTVLKDCKVKRGIEILSYFAMMVFTSVTSINYPNSIVLPITCFIFLMILSTIYEGGIWVKIISNLILGTVFVLAEAITVSIIIAMTGRSLQFIKIM